MNERCSTIANFICDKIFTRNSVQRTLTGLGAKILQFKYPPALYTINKHLITGHIYRPHPKDDGRLYFHFVCQSTPGGGGVPIP